jgi:hypothetical protein
VLLPSALELVYVELALGAALLWPVVAEAREVSIGDEGLSARRLWRMRTLAWRSITEIVCRPTVAAPDRIRIVSGQGQVRLSRRNPGLAAVLDAIEARSPTANRIRGTWLRR